MKPKRMAMWNRLHRRREPGVSILRAVQTRLIERWHTPGVDKAEQEDITDALSTCQLCISRIRSDLRV